MGKASRDKGGRGERELAKKLSDYGIPSERGVQRSGSPDSPDVKTAYDYMWHIECKRTERLQLWPSLEQCEEDSGDDQIPVVMHRPNSKPWLAITYLCDFVNLVHKANMYDKLCKDHPDAKIPHVTD